MLEATARFFQAGGPMMWVILAVLAAAAAIIVERLLFFRRAARADVGLDAATAIGRLIEDDARGALAVLAGADPAHALMRRAVTSALDGADPGEIRAGVEELAVVEMPRFGRRLGDLATLANVATLAGLLGTIFGLQQSFSALAAAAAVEKAAVLAAGIAQAMNTTAFGLIVAIPCLVVQTRLVGLAARRTEMCDAAVLRLLNYFDARAAQPRALNRVAS